MSIKEALMKGAESLVKDESNSYYRGFLYSWTGWKTFPDSSKIVGQWLAIDKDDNKIFSSVPGTCSNYELGHVFNTSIQPYQTYLDATSSEETKELEKDKGLELLKQVIDSICEKRNV